MARAGLAASTTFYMEQVNLALACGVQLQHTTITNPLGIWGRLREGLWDHLAQRRLTGRVRIRGGGEDMRAGLVPGYQLYHIQQILNEYGKSLEGLSLPQ